EKNRSKHVLRGDTLYIGAAQAGFALKTFDRMNDVPNKNGVYRISMYVDEQLWHQFTCERFAFHQSRGINAHMDYAEFKLKKSSFNRCYSLPGNRVPLYDNVVNKGIVPLSTQKASKIRMVAEDIAGNASEVVFWAKQSKTQRETLERTYNYKLPYTEENIIDNGSMYLYFPKNSLYETLYLDYRMSTDFSDMMHSPVHHIHHKHTPLNKYCDIALRPSTLPDNLKYKAFVAQCDEGNSITNVGHRWKDERLWGRIRSFGNYSIMVDTIAPRITPLRFQRNMRGKSQMTFRIEDNFATGGGAGGLKYRATVDDTWILMEYDAKYDKLLHRFDGQISSGTHTLKLSVTDAMGNTETLVREFVR
ncbi:MAG: hypothetical protein AAF738_02580, partial [Bacteroidota bacterium]